MSRFNLSRDHKLYYFDLGVEQVMRLCFTLLMQDVFGKIKREASLSVELDINRANPVTGPVGILDTKRGDSSCV